jgi:hypothetical protein
MATETVWQNDIQNSEYSFLLIFSCKTIKLWNEGMLNYPWYDFICNLILKKHNL